MAYNRDEGQKNYPSKGVIQMVQSNGNGDSEKPEISVTFEPVNDETQQVQDRWVRFGGDGNREITYSDRVREELEIDEDEESDSD